MRVLTIDLISVNRHLFVSRIARFEQEFFKLVDLDSAAAKTDIAADIVDFIFRYWILKRRAAGNKPLLIPRLVSLLRKLLNVTNGALV